MKTISTSQTPFFGGKKFFFVIFDFRLVLFFSNMVSTLGSTNLCIRFSTQKQLLKKNGCSGGSRSGARGSRRPSSSLIFRPNWGLKGRKFSSDRSTLLIWKSGSATGLVVQRSSSTNEHLHSAELNVVAVTENLNTFLLVWTHVSR